MERSSGVLMHISSLWGKYSIGSFGKEAREWVDFLHNSGFRYWQVLPFCLPDEFHSPYKSYSAFSLNPSFIDLETLMDHGLLRDSELRKSEQISPYLCEFNNLENSRIELLKLAASRAAERPEIVENVGIFLQKHPKIAEFVLFMAKKEANNGAPWDQWTTENYDENVSFAWAYMQYEFMRQWQELHKYATSRGVKIIGDIPIYIAYDSCDMMCNREQFLLGKDGKPSLVAGVPPDYFCPDGQLWGNPLYDWEKMKKDGYSWWTARFEHMFELFDAVRVDHFRGFSSFFAIPADAENARSGKWMEGPGLPFIEKIRSLAGGKEIIAEDLGDVDENVHRLVEQSGFPGMRVFQFGWDGDTNNRHLPHTYDKNSVAYSGTHDNNTLLGFYLEASEELRTVIRAYCGVPANCRDCSAELDGIERTLFASPAKLLILPVQDLLRYGADTRMNTPGNPKRNWAYRVTREQIMGIDSAKFRTWSELYGRF